MRWIAPLTVGLLLVLQALLSTSCDQTDCGDGTIEVDGVCQPLQAANCTGAGVVFENGRCVPALDAICGPGTAMNDAGTQCVSTGGGGGDPEPDMGLDDMAGDVGGDDTADAGDADAPIVFDPMCADDLEAGTRVCLWGRVFNFVDGTPVPGDADPALEVQVKDLVTALSDPEDVVDETLIQAGGYFSLPAVDLGGPPQQLIMIVGEAEDGEGLEGPGESWQRAISGLVGTSDSIDEHGDLRLFLVEREDVSAWNATLGFNPPAPGLHVNGFVLARIIDAETNAPIAGATFDFLGASDVAIRYFSDAALTEFGGEATGPAGVAMLTGSSATEFCNATADGFTSTGQVNCGTSPQRVTIIHILMLAD